MLYLYREIFGFYLLSGVEFMSSNSEKILGIGTEIKIEDQVRVVKQVTRDGIVLDDGSTVSKAEVEFALDAFRSK